MKQYATSLVATTERLAAQVAILRKEKTEQESILGSRKKKLLSKRAVFQHYFMLSMVEIQAKVVAAELETVQNKTPKRQSKKNR